MCFNDVVSPRIYTLSLHDALPISAFLDRLQGGGHRGRFIEFLFITLPLGPTKTRNSMNRSEEHTSELQSRENLVCRLLLEKKKVGSEWAGPFDQMLS